jgi:DNA-directed RNA polymerase specialized sigma subunit
MPIVDKDRTIMLPSNKRKEFRLRSQLPELKRKMEISLGRRITNTEIAEATGLNLNTIAKWLSPEPFGRVESHSATQLMKWASCTLDELLEPVEVEIEN